MENKENEQRKGKVAMYDEALAQEVLTSLEKSFPYTITLIELKHSLAVEPSDDKLLTALDALLQDGKIDGMNKRGQGRKLLAMANIQITPKGRDHLKGTAPIHSVVHGDQINNFGHAGAIGRDSRGVLNIQSRWSEAVSQIDLQALALELETLRTEFRKTASSREDDKQLVLLGDAAEKAEKGDNVGVAVALSKIGTRMLKIAKEAGTELAAKIIAELIKPN